MTDDSLRLGPILWSTSGTKGILNKKIVWKAGFDPHIFYTVKFDDNGENPVTNLEDIKTMDVVVLRSYRQGSMGMSYGWGMGIRTYMPRTSNTVGDVKFFLSSGKNVATLTIDDPHGVVSLFKTAKKNYLAEIKGYKFPAQRKVEVDAEKAKSKTHLASDLSKLAKLLEKGELTKEEYETAKAAILK